MMNTFKRNKMTSYKSRYNQSANNISTNNQRQLLLNCSIFYQTKASSNKKFMQNMVTELPRSWEFLF